MKKIILKNHITAGSQEKNLRKYCDKRKDILNNYKSVGKVRSTKENESMKSVNFKVLTNIMVRRVKKTISDETRR